MFMMMMMMMMGRRDNDGTGRSISPAAGGHIVALMTRPRPKCRYWA